MVKMITLRLHFSKKMITEYFLCLLCTNFIYLYQFCPRKYIQYICLFDILLNVNKNSWRLSSKAEILKVLRMALTLLPHFPSSTHTTSPPHTHTDMLKYTHTLTHTTLCKHIFYQRTFRKICAKTIDSDTLQQPFQRKGSLPLCVFPPKIIIWGCWIFW